MTGFVIPTLRTERLTLRAPMMGDFDAFAAYCATDRADGAGDTCDRTAAFRQFMAISGHWQLRGFGRWLVADANSDAALGVVGLYHPDDWPEPEIAWSVFEQAEGRGIAYEAACAARAYAYETLGWSTLVSLTSPDNTRSIALAKRMGAHDDGLFEHPSFGPLKVWRHLSSNEVTQ